MLHLYPSLLHSCNLRNITIFQRKSQKVSRVCMALNTDCTYLNLPPHESIQLARSLMKEWEREWLAEKHLFGQKDQFIAICRSSLKRRLNWSFPISVTTIYSHQMSCPFFAANHWFTSFFSNEQLLSYASNDSI